MEKKRIVGYISNYIYESQDSLYKVCKLITDDEELTIVGSFPHLEDGLSYEFIGDFRSNLKYGEQFFVESYSRSNSISKEGLIEYLSSEKFVGIGLKTATNIVDVLGCDAITKILNDKACLDEVKGLNETKRKIIYEVLKENEAIDKTFVDLYSFGLSSKMVLKLYERYGANAANLIKENPYRLIDDVDGFGFKKCDNLAITLGFLPNDPKRIKAAIIYTINFICYQEGFTYITHEQLLNSTMSLLNISNIELIDKIIGELILENKLVHIDDKFYDSYLYKCETSLKDKILNMQSKPKFSIDKVRAALEYVESTIDIKYTPMQREAIINSLSNKLSIITGGPGTGKSTILKGILNCYARLMDMSLSDIAMQQKISLASPTGRASKRMVEATGFKAQTIHKLLGYNYDQTFNYNEYNLLSTSLLIIDEVSMLDIMLASSLFKALQNDTIVILVGDINQLPSVGPGNVLYDLMNTNVFKTTKLNEILRQAANSNIIKLSQMVLNEKIDYRLFLEKKEVYFYNSDTKDTIDQIFKILDAYVKRGLDLISGIQILAPMYKGICGIDAINQAVQNRYNHEEKFVKRDDKLFKKGDKVLQLRNNPELDIMNGDIGYVLDVLKVEGEDALLISFDEHIVTYKAQEFDNLTLAYAISIHKAQGSEFDNVIMPILPSYQIMLKKRIIYTGITRSKQKLILIGNKDTLSLALKNIEYQRQTSLSSLINGTNEKRSTDNRIRIEDSDIPFEYLGEYDMEGITPYSFLED